MQQITDGILNITVTNTPGGDSILPVPNTGFGDFVNALGPVGCTITSLAVIAFLITLIFFCLRSKFRNLRCLSILPVGLVAFTIGLTVPAVVVTADATDTKVVNLDITTKSGETTTATATTNINIGTTSRAYMVYAYIEGSSILTNTINPEATIKPTTPTTSSDPNFLTTNTYGIRTDTTNGFTSLSSDSKHPTLLYSADTASTGGVLTITYGIKADSTLTAGTYSNADSTNTIKYVVEPQHAFTLKYATATPASHMPTMTTYGPAAVQEHVFTIPSDTENIPARTDGYAFSGWCHGNITTGITSDTCDGDVYHPGDNITLDIDPTTATDPDVTTTLNAMWQKVVLKYDANGGTGAPAEQVIPSGGSIPYTFTISTTQPTRTGYTFLHWNTKADGTGDSYNPGDQITASGEVILYAIWQAEHHTITYKSYDDNTLYGTQEFVYDTVQAVRAYDAESGWTIKPIAPTGKTFVGWTKTQGSTTPDYTDGQTISDLLADTTVYAIWKQDLTLNFHQGNGTNAKIEKTIYNGAVDATYTAPTVLNRSSETPTQTIVGWGESDTATTSVIGSGATGQTISQTNDNKNYYAVYSYPVKANYNANGGTGSTTATTCTAHSTSKLGVSGYNLTACTLNLANNSFSKTGYTFANWAEGSTSGTRYNAGAPRNLTADTTYYAMWDANTYSIAYNLDGGTSGGSQPTTATYDTDFNISNPTKTNYIFKGWTITGMDSTTHYYGDNTSSYNTSTATSLSSIKATWFKNLRSTSGTVTFTANWGIPAPAGSFDAAFENAGKIQDPTTNLYRMQDMDAIICNNVASPTSATAGDEQTTTLVDIRDGKTYAVGKLMDGKCWMTQNLQLGSATDAITLTSSDTDLASGTTSYVLPTSSSNWPIGDTNTPAIYYDANNTGTSKDEVFYNYNAVTAGSADSSVTSGEAAGSICSKGWKIPTGGGTAGQFYDLSAAYDEDYNNINAAFKLAFAGFFYATDGVRQQGYLGHWWSSTIEDVTLAYKLYAVCNDDVGPFDFDNRINGLSVRCVAR